MSRDDCQELFYRKLLCAAIGQAIDWAKGNGLSSVSFAKHSHSAAEDRNEAINYIYGPEFVRDMGLLNLENEIDVVREETKKYLPKVYQKALAIEAINE